MRIAGLSWMQVEELARRESRAVLPIGSTEQHAYLSLAVDAILAERVAIEAEVVERGWVRDFFGFNRAKHAVLEAAILATRTAILPREEIDADMRRLAVIVDKTAGPREQAAFQFLREHLQQAQDAPR